MNHPDDDRLRAAARRIGEWNPDLARAKALFPSARRRRGQRRNGAAAGVLAASLVTFGVVGWWPPGVESGQRVGVLASATPTAEPPASESPAGSESPVPGGEQSAEPTPSPSESCFGDECPDYEDPDHDPEPEPSVTVTATAAEQSCTDDVDLAVDETSNGGRASLRVEQRLKVTLHNPPGHQWEFPTATKAEVGEPPDEVSHCMFVVQGEDGAILEKGIVVDAEEPGAIQVSSTFESPCTDPTDCPHGGVYSLTVDVQPA